MTDFSITAAAGVGPGLILRRPLAVLAWGFLPFVVIVPLLLVFGGGILALVAQLSQLAQAGATGEQAAPAIASAIGGMMLFILLAILLAWVVGAMTSAAAFRAVLHPEQSAFAYLRFGGQEFMLMLVALVQGLVFFGVGVALAIPTTIISLAATNSPQGVRVGLTLALALVREGVTLWIWLRLCMAMPMTFEQRQFRLFESWALTRGHTLKLFIVGVLVILIVVAIEIVMLILGAGGLVFSGGAIAMLRANPQAAAAHPAQLLAAFGPALIEWGILLAIFQGLATAVLRAPLAYIYRALEGADVSATFA